MCAEDGAEPLPAALSSTGAKARTHVRSLTRFWRICYEIGAVRWSGLDPSRFAFPALTCRAIHMPPLRGWCVVYRRDRWPSS